MKIKLPKKDLKYKVYNYFQTVISMNDSNYISKCSCCDKNIIYDKNRYFKLISTIKNLIIN